MVGTLHLMYGLAGSGKSTLARRLEREQPAVRFTLDEWMLRLHPHLTIEDDAYGELSGSVRELIWSIAEQVLRTGTDVVLDWNAWSCERRAWAVQRAGVVGAPIVLHQLCTPAAESTRRAAERYGTDGVYAHPISRESNEHLAALMEQPEAAEGFRIQRW